MPPSPLGDFTGILLGESLFLLLLASLEREERFRLEEASAAEEIIEEIARLTGAKFWTEN
jgi:hypothetical protein